MANLQSQRVVIDGQQTCVSWISVPNVEEKLAYCSKKKVINAGAFVLDFNLDIDAFSNRCSRETGVPIARWVSTGPYVVFYIDAKNLHKVAAVRTWIKNQNYELYTSI